jgi:hypothetical protein
MVLSLAAVLGLAAVLVKPKASVRQASLPQSMSATSIDRAAKIAHDRAMAAKASPQGSDDAITLESAHPRVAPAAAAVDDESFARLELEQLDRLRKIPGAAPLLDDILAYLKNDPDDSVSLDNLPTDEHGLAEIDDEAIERLIPDAELRAKWEKLAELIAAHPEAKSL